jgi:hypothetical protein
MPTMTQAADITAGRCGAPCAGRWCVLHAGGQATGPPPDGYRRSRRAGLLVVTVGYQDYDHENGYSDRTREHMIRVTRAAFARHLRRAGYVAEPWMRYDNVQPGLFITRKSGGSR